MNLNDWAAECRTTVRKDLDNLILFSGFEGSGKSTLMLQVLSLLDPNFDAKSVYFTTEDFIRGCTRASRYSAVAADEALLNHRKGMHGGTIQFLDFLQVCRGLNLHMAVCFPHEAMLDKAVKHFRVRWNFHVPERGIAILRVPITREVRYHGETELVHYWKPILRLRTAPNTGTLWREYLERKNQHMRSMADRLGASSSGKAGGKEWTKEAW